MLQGLFACSLESVLALAAHVMFILYEGGVGPENIHTLSVRRTDGGLLRVYHDEQYLVEGLRFVLLIFSPAMVEPSDASVFLLDEFVAVGVECYCLTTALDSNEQFLEPADDALSGLNTLDIPSLRNLTLQK